MIDELKNTSFDPTDVKEDGNFCEMLNILDKLQFAQSTTDDIDKKNRKISDLMDELSVKNSKIMEQQNCIHILESALRENSNIAELEQLLTVIKSKDDRVSELEQLLNASNINYDADKSKDDRISELEEALKESVLIAAEREKIFYEEEKGRLKMVERVCFIQLLYLLFT